MTWQQLIQEIESLTLEERKRLIHLLVDSIAAAHPSVASHLSVASHPSQPEQQPRIPGLHPNSTWVSDDFDAPLSDRFWLG